MRGWSVEKAVVGAGIAYSGGWTLRNGALYVSDKRRGEDSTFWVVRKLSLIVLKRQLLRKAMQLALVLMNKSFTENSGAMSEGASSVDTVAASDNQSQVVCTAKKIRWNAGEDVRYGNQAAWRVAGEVVRRGQRGGMRSRWFWHSWHMVSWISVATDFVFDQQQDQKFWRTTLFEQKYNLMGDLIRNPWMLYNAECSFAFRSYTTRLYFIHFFVMVDPRETISDVTMETLEV